MTILYISHKMDEVFRLADRITVLRDGRLVQTVPREQTSPRRDHAPDGRPRDRGDESRRPASAGRRSAARSRNLSLPWPGHAGGWRLKDISFSLRRGEILGIAGLMGAGRTELLECLFGASLDRPQGEIMLDEQAVAFPPSGRSRARPASRW